MTIMTTKRHPAYLRTKIEIRIASGQEGAWKAARELREFCLSDIAARVEGDRNAIGDYLRRLVKGGFLSASAPAPGEAVTYRLEIDQAETPRVRKDGTLIVDPRGRGQDNMWRSMKMLGRFRADDIARAAAIDGVSVTLATAKAYLGALASAGYIDVVSEPRPGFKRGTGAVTVYAINPTRNSGPQAPRIMRCKAIHDPNDDKVYSLPDQAEEVAP